jgi:hypothetical protein
MKKAMVTLTSLALGMALNLGVASAHENFQPTPPPPSQPVMPQNNDVDEQGDHQSGEQGTSKANTTTGKENGQMGEQDANVDEQGASKANTTTGTQNKEGQSGNQQDGEFDVEN